MKKMMFVIFSLMTVTLRADWLNDLAALVDKHNFLPEQEAYAVIEQYIARDREEIKTLEAQQKQNGREQGLAATVRSTACKAQLIKVGATLSYHEKVADYLNELAQNKKEREHFVDNCLKLAQLDKELAHLQKSFDRTHSAGKAARTQAKIAAKIAHIEAKKATMKAAIL